MASVGGSETKGKGAGEGAKPRTGALMSGGSFPVDVMAYRRWRLEAIRAKTRPRTRVTEQEEQS